ncbi:uncharacterized protein BT62DRAFT_935013 [Guyanagaster necrorhizus]|uniref:Secreted protein n=1 Tax=Guyanagaster necrorhizus TaxID=856835 RepID=A0A9P7VN59_9AGAR|nr:uncharacterized protein BT62DRAFT_935013 [Guyanagaster necrorhizus MCA 3950]KAG7443400.1 hypothetical protein BT62DRAFT_935013 [Guyanagaster necrorhizus MCA 3950]
MFSVKQSFLLFRLCPFVWSMHWPEKPFGTQYSPNGILEACDTPLQDIDHFVTFSTHQFCRK